MGPRNVRWLSCRSPSWGESRPGWPPGESWACRARWPRPLGRIARADEAPEEAAAALTDALGSFEAAHARFEAARTRLDLAELCVSRGDREEAARHLAGLAETFTASGAPRYADRAAAMTARLRGAPAGGSGSGSLEHAESGDGSAVR